MASLDHRLNPLFSIKECSSCGALYTADFCCSKGGLEDKILVPKPPQNCATCGDPVDGLYCRSCAFVRKCLNEGWYTIHDENEILNTSESSNDNTNIVSAPQEPLSSIKTPSCENGALYGYNCPSKARIISIRKTMAIKPLMSSHNFNKFFDPTETPKVLTRAWEKFFEIQHAQPKDIQELLHKLLKDLQIISEEMAEYINLPSWNRPTYYYEDDDDEYTIAITPDLPTEEPDNSLSMGDEHLSTIPETESDEVIKSSVENLVPIPSETEDFSDIESECDVPVCDDSTTFSNPLFDSDNDYTSSDDESFSNENVPKEIYSNPLFDEEIISDKINASIISSLKIDSLLEQFSGELAHIDPIPPGIEKADFDLEEEIRLVENLLYDNSSPRPPEELNLEIADMILESLSPSPIPVEDSDSHMEEVDLFLTTDDSMPPGIKNDDYNSKGDIRFLEELLSIDPLPLPEIESSNLDHFNDPSSSRPPLEPPDVKICFNFEPDTGVVTTKVVGDISENDVLMPNLLPTQPTLCPVFDLLLPFSSENEDKVFNPGILISPLLSHRGEIISNFSKSPMMISRGDIPDTLSFVFIRKRGQSVQSWYSQFSYLISSGRITS
ncbi:hypothetical protein Tco_0238557 [Tanacetum coccineum]